MASSEEIARLATLVAAYRAAELAVLRNKSYEMPDGRKLQRENLAEIRAGLKEAEGRFDQATGSIRPVGRMRRAGI